MSLLSLQKLMHSNFLHQSALTCGQTRYAMESLQRLYNAAHWRKIETFLIPAIGSAGDQAERVAAELDALRRVAAESLKVAGQWLLDCAIDTEARVAEFCQVLDTVCKALLQRIDKEEQDLFPIARAVISGEAWFSIANQMLLHEAYREDSKRAGSSGPIVLLPDGAPARIAPAPVPLSAAQRRA